jgi:heat shock protein HtpX
MISALRKIEGRGELEGATSAVMEMCIDNPREGFADLFATHPAIESRIAALVQHAGGHDPGPLALPEPGESPLPGEQQAPDDGSGSVPTIAEGGEQKPFLPERPPVTLGPDQTPGQAPGPWGTPNRN